MKMTIYVPDDLAEKVKGYEDMNVSAVCQDALREEVSFREAAGDLDSDMKRVRVRDNDGEVEKEFVGVMIVGETRDLVTYLTEGHRIAIEDVGKLRFYVYENYDELAQDESLPAELVSGVARALDREYVEVLDI